MDRVKLPRNIQIPRNIHLDTQDETIFWYIWGKNLNMTEILNMFRTIFSELLQRHEIIDCAMFCVDNICETETITKVVYIFKNNESNTFLRRIRLVSRYKAFISEMIMIGRDVCKSVTIEDGCIKFVDINFFACHALIAPQLTYLQSRIANL